MGGGGADSAGPPTLVVMADEDETPWYRPLLVGVGAMLGVAVLVGGLVAVVALGAVSVTGLGDERVSVEETEPTLFIPDRTPGGDEEAEDDGPTLEELTGIDGAGEDTDEQGAEQSQAPKPDRKKPRKPRSVISLSASPLQVASMERIYLTGTYPGGEGASLRVQRFEGSWTDFSGVTATVSGGTFSTYVMTGQSGTNRFRVLDPSGGKASNEVRVQVG